MLPSLRGCPIETVPDRAAYGKLGSPHRQSFCSRPHMPDSFSPLYLAAPPLHWLWLDTGIALVWFHGDAA
jgi:hypothetical protein